MTMPTRTESVDAVERERCTDLVAGRRLEWLVTNGRGGFAMGTVSQMLTRRYHGLLVAAIDPPVERYVLLAKLDATVVIGGVTYDLATNEYCGVVQPQGCKLLESFRTRPYPTWRWRAAGHVIEETLCMAPDEDTTFVRFRLLEGGEAVALAVRPFCTSRHFHALAHRWDLFDPEVDARRDALTFRWRNGRPSWQISHNGRFRSQPDWYYRFFLHTENERGYDDSQDLYTPGDVTAVLSRHDPTGLVFAASTQGRSWEGWSGAFDAAAARETTLRASQPTRPASFSTSTGSIAKPAPTARRDSVKAKRASARKEPATEPAIQLAGDPLFEPLVRASRDFLVVREGDLKTVIAGYPWFGDWGRDTFICLPGLCLVQGKFDEARRIILAFARHVSRGMIPNRFPDYGEPPAYNTVDASLWYVQAIDRYLAYTNDRALLADHAYPAVREILLAHEQGTRHRIRLCEDGLIAAGEPGEALTWMDAKVGRQAFTPRIGKPVEINALWYNALQVAASLAETLHDAGQAAHWRQLAAQTQVAFNRRFWNERSGCLYDVVDADDEPGKDDPAIRPNQLLGVSLPHPVLDRSRWQPVVSVCRQHLLTPLGLRTLSPRDPAYVGRYRGDLAQRDAAYHQGTVWPWLLGPFVTAYVKAHDASTDARQTARGFLDGLLDHLREDGFGSVCEVADGDAPHVPGGCPWQAWSVAEPLRALVEDVYASEGTRSRAACGEQCASSPTAGRGAV